MAAARNCRVRPLWFIDSPFSKMGVPVIMSMPPSSSQISTNQHGALFTAAFFYFYFVHLEIDYARYEVEMSRHISWVVMQSFLFWIVRFVVPWLVAWLPVSDSGQTWCPLHPPSWAGVLKAETASSLLFPQQVWERGIRLLQMLHFGAILTFDHAQSGWCVLSATGDFLCQICCSCSDASITFSSQVVNIETSPPWPFVSQQTNSFVLSMDVLPDKLDS